MKRYYIGCFSLNKVPCDCKFNVIDENKIAYHFISEMGKFNFWVTKKYLEYCTKNHKCLKPEKLYNFVEKEI